MIHRKEQREFLLLRFSTKMAGKINLVIFHKRFADGLAIGFEERVSHAAADEHGVGNHHQIFDNFDFVADFRSAQDGHEGARGIRDRFAEISQFLFHEQASGSLLDKTRDADNGSVRAVSRAKGVANKDAVAKRGELFGKASSFFSSSG